MATEIRESSSSDSRKHRKPALLNKLEGHQDTINCATLIKGEDGVISVSDDKTIRVWLKRDTGQYWPSICHTLTVGGTSLYYNNETRRLFVGTTSGVINEFQLSEDFNKLSAKREYIAHQGRVTDVVFSLPCELVLSTARDQYFQWHCSETARRLGGVPLKAWCTCLVFDDECKLAFVGDYSGKTTIIKLKDTAEYEIVTTLKGHQGSIRAVAWDAEKELLFTGSYDNSVIIWDIGGKKGVAYDLQAHIDKVQALAYAPKARQLFSAADDSSLVIWDLSIKRQETPEWAESDMCMICNTPFFWNVKQMWESKTWGRRQHHCRKCGKALCENCCTTKSTLPAMGFENPVRMCAECLEGITPEDRAPAATKHDVKHRTISMDLDEPLKKLLTVGSTDRVIKLWDVSAVLH